MLPGVKFPPHSIGMDSIKKTPAMQTSVNNKVSAIFSYLSYYAVQSEPFPYLVMFKPQTAYAAQFLYVRFRINMDVSFAQKRP